MNDAQFDVICKLTRCREDSAGSRAARLVLVHGWYQIDAAQETQATRSSVSDAVKRITAAYELILTEFRPKGSRS